MKIFVSGPLFLNASRHNPQNKSQATFSYNFIRALHFYLSYCLDTKCLWTMTTTTTKTLIRTTEWYHCTTTIILQSYKKYTNKYDKNFVIRKISLLFGLVNLTHKKCQSTLESSYDINDVHEWTRIHNHPVKHWFLDSRTNSCFHLSREKPEM